MDDAEEIALAGVVAVLGGIGTQVAQAAQATQAGQTAQAAQAGRFAEAANGSAAAISDVQVGWTDAAHVDVKITWSESTPVANTLTLKSTAADVPENKFGTTTAVDPNEYVISATDLGYTADAAAKAWIVVGDPDGGQAQSLYFDTFLYYTSKLTFSFTADNQVRWTVPADTSTDSTPNDPLDLHTKEYRYLAQRRIDNDPNGTYECDETNFPETTTTTGLIPNAGKPYSLWVNIDNEWGTRNGPYVTVDTTSAITIAAPTVTKYGENTTITGMVSGRTVFESGMPPVCNEENLDPANQPVTLQSRTSSTAAWTTVGTTKTDAQGNYTAVVKNQGYREYRIVRPNTAAGDYAAYGATGASKVVRSPTRVVSAKFIAPIINYGTKPQAYLWVDPAGSQQAAVQFKNASGVWQGITYKTLSAGRGIATFTFNRRGATQFRWWVSASPGVDATYSGIFTLTV